MQSPVWHVRTDLTTPVSDFNVTVNAVTPTGSDDPNRLWALAGQNADGEVALLIANPNDTPTSWQALFAGNAAALTLMQVSDASDAVQTFTLETPAAEIGAYTVQLLVVKP